MAEKLCDQHSGHEARLNSLEKADSEMTRSLDTIHRRVDGMKNWVIAGMTSLVLQLVIAVVMLFLNKRG